MLAAASARGDEAPFRPEDQVDVTQVDRHLIAVVGSGVPPVETDLELGEYVVALRSQGFVGVIATNRRLLAVRSQGADFAELRYRIAEKPVQPDAIHVLDRLAVAELGTRLVGFTIENTNWVSLGLGPGEKPRRIEADGGNIAVLVTPRRAIAFGSRSSSFVEETLLPEEDVERVSTSDASITLVLPNKILIFHNGDGRWTSLIR